MESTSNQLRSSVLEALGDVYDKVACLVKREGNSLEMTDRLCNIASLIDVASLLMHMTDFND